MSSLGATVPFFHGEFRMTPALRRGLTGLVLGVSVTALVGCGTVFHPERKGQVSGRIDPVVAIANGVGLLFFIVPGVVAYAVCLLYTSPSPRDRTRSRMPSSA